MNGDSLIGLDGIDKFKKNWKENQHKKKLEILNKFKEANLESHRLFQSATVFNEECIASLKTCPYPIKKLNGIGKTKVQNKGFGLELLCGSSILMFINDFQRGLELMCKLDCYEYHSINMV